MLRFNSFIALHEENQAKSHQTEHRTRAAFQQHLDTIKKQTGKDYVPIKHLGQTHHITHVEDAGEGYKGPAPKADFRLVDKKNNHIFLSHKKYDTSKGGSPEKHFVSLGGTTHMSDSHSLIKKLAGHVKKFFGGSMLSKGTVHVALDPKKPEHEKIIKHAMFGTGHGDEQHHENNIQSIVHGDMGLSKNKDNTHSITAPHMEHHNEPIKGKFGIFARGGTGRSNHGLTDTRTQIGAIGSRKSTEIK